MTTATKTLTEVPVVCMVCRKDRATLMVKDNGFQTYPVCKTCCKGMHFPTIIRKLS